MFDRERMWNGRRKTIMLVVAALLATLPFAGFFASDVGASCSGDDAYDPAAGGHPELSIAANPELGYAALSVVEEDPAFLAANPELVLARRHARAPRGDAEEVFLAANPELGIARRYNSAGSGGSYPSLVGACGLPGSEAAK